MRRASLLGLSLFLVAALSGCAESGRAPGAAGSPSGGGYQGALLSQPLALPDAALTATDGSTYDFGARDRGKLRLVFFGYTKCPDTCPTTMSDIAVALRKVSAAARAKTQVVFVTTDPKRDSVQVMREWLGRFDESFLGLTGSTKQIQTAADALGVPLLESEKLPDGGYDIPHGAQVIAFTPDGKAHLIWLAGTQVKQYRADIERLLADPQYRS